MKIIGGWIAAEPTQRVCAALTGAGFRALFVGGCVRNAHDARRWDPIEAKALGPGICRDDRRSNVKGAPPPQLLIATSISPALRAREEAKGKITMDDQPFGC